MRLYSAHRRIRFPFYSAMRTQYVAHCRISFFFYHIWINIRVQYTLYVVFVSSQNLIQKSITYKSINWLVTGTTMWTIRKCTSSWTALQTWSSASSIVIRFFCRRHSTSNYCNYLTSSSVNVLYFEILCRCRNYVLKHMGGPRFVYDAITQSMHPIASAATAEQLGRRLANAAVALHESTQAILSTYQWINFALYS